jgi:hypothetical protein
MGAVPTRGRGSRYKLPGYGGPEGGAVPDSVVYIVVLLGSNIFIASKNLPFHTEPKSLLN